MEADQREAERLLEMAEQDKDERLTALMKVSRSPSPRLRVFFSILVVSYFMWSGVLDSSDVLLSHFITSLA